MNEGYMSLKEKTIGELIKNKVSEKGLSKKEFASLIFCKRGNIYKIFDRKRMDVGLLLTISNALKYDFFQLYSEQVRIDKKQIIPNNAQIYIEVNIPMEEIEKNKICKYCEINREK